MPAIYLSSWLKVAALAGVQVLSRASDVSPLFLDLNDIITLLFPLPN